jgi:ABC-2 type transport system permease protein
MNDLNILRNTLKDLFRPKKLIVVLIVAALPLLVAVLWRVAAPADQFVKSDVYNRLSDLLIFGFVLVMLACVFGTNLVAQEVEQKTIVYLLTRPVPRWRILLMKYLAAFLATTLATWLAAMLLFTVTTSTVHLTHTAFGRDLIVIPIGCLAYGGLFLLIATLFRRPLVIGLIYTFAVESWLPNLPGNFKMLSLMAYLRALAPHPLSTADPTDIATDITQALAWKVVIGVVIVTVTAACVVFSTSEYVPRDDV